MDPRLVGSFPADGSDGHRYTVRVWLAFRAGGAPDPLPTMTTGDGLPVRAADDDPETFTVFGAGTTLTGNPALAHVAFWAAYESAANADRPQD